VNQGLNYIADCKFRNLDLTESKLRNAILLKPLLSMLKTVCVF